MRIMRIGMMIGEGAGESPSMDEVIRRAQRIEEAGLATGWLAQIFTYDAIALLGLVGRETQRIELGTAVVPTYPRHPAVMAQAALTAQAASQGRFTLGIGLSHQMVIEQMYGFPYKRHLLHMREYLSVLKPMLRGPITHRVGSTYNDARGQGICRNQFRQSFGAIGEVVYVGWAHPSLHVLLAVGSAPGVMVMAATHLQQKHQSFSLLMD